MRRMGKPSVSRMRPPPEAGQSRLHERRRKANSHGIHRRDGSSSRRAKDRMRGDLLVGVRQHSGFPALRFLTQLDTVEGVQRHKAIVEGAKPKRAFDGRYIRPTLKAICGEPLQDQRILPRDHAFPRDAAHVFAEVRCEGFHVALPGGDRAGRRRAFAAFPLIEDFVD